MRSYQCAGVMAATAAVIVAGCSNGADADPSPAGRGAAVSAENSSQTVTAPTGPAAPSRGDRLIAAATDLNHRAANGDYRKAWQYYSQRCKNIIGGLESYGYQMDYLFKDRDPEWAGVTVRINGSSAQVVSVDKSATAPAGAMDPRTWTFIDGRWQFDNC